MYTKTYQGSTCEIKYNFTTYQISNLLKSDNFCLELANSFKTKFANYRFTVCDMTIDQPFVITLTELNPIGPYGQNGRFFPLTKKIQTIPSPHGTRLILPPNVDKDFRNMKYFIKNASDKLKIQYMREVFKKRRKNLHTLGIHVYWLHVRYNL